MCSDPIRPGGGRTDAFARPVRETNVGSDEKSTVDTTDAVETVLSGAGIEICAVVTSAIDSLRGAVGTVASGERR
jgi:homoserine kinase